MPVPTQDPNPTATFDQLDVELTGLAKQSAEAREMLMQAKGRQQEALSKEMAASLSLDVEAMARKLDSAHREEQQAALDATLALRGRTRELVRRQATLFDEKLRDLRKSGFANTIERACHNPRMLMKLCFDWHGEGSPPPGMTGVSNTADWHFDTIEDSRFGAFVDRVHAHARADAGDRHYEHARGDVDLALRFTHAPRAEQTVAEQVSVDLSAFGMIESDPSSDMFASQTRALSAGGWAGFSASVTLAQDFTWPSGLRDTHRLELGTVELASCSSLGAIWVLGWIPIPLGGAPCWEPIRLRQRLAFPTVFPIYGRTNPREPYGNDVHVEVRLHLHTTARGEGAAAAIDLRASEGFSLRVHEVIVETAD